MYRFGQTGLNVRVLLIQTLHLIERSIKRIITSSILNDYFAKSLVKVAIFHSAGVSREQCSNRAGVRIGVGDYHCQCATFDGF